MFTVEHEFDYTKVVIMDDRDEEDDVILRLCEDRVYIQQYVEEEGRHHTIILTNEMFTQLKLALDAQEGAFLLDD